jgi:hypothetical protein
MSKIRVVPVLSVMSHKDNSIANAAAEALVSAMGMCPRTA